VSHPLDLLAPYVDGTLDPTERAVVDDHLRGCTRCAREIEAASAGRRALRDLPAPEPPDLASRFTPHRLEELATPRPAPRAARSRLLTASAAAAVVVLLAIALPRLGDGADVAGTAADGAAEAADGGPVRLELDATDYDEPALQAAAAAFAGSFEGAAAGAIEGDVTAPEATAAASGDQARVAGPGRSAKAVACLQEAFPGFPGRLVSLRMGSFEGTPAFLGFVVEGPGGGADPDAVSIWVASARDCSILSLASARI
jgi:anti-sigma factor RsiW